MIICRKLPLYPMELMPAGFQTDLLLAKDKLISNSGGTSGAVYYRREKNIMQEKVEMGGMRIHERLRETALQNTKEGRTCWKRVCWKPCSLCLHGKAAVSLKPMEVHGGGEIHLQSLEEPTLEQVFWQGL